MLPHEVPKPFEPQNASRRLRFRMPANHALILFACESSPASAVSWVAPLYAYSDYVHPFRHHNKFALTNAASGTLPSAGLNVVQATPSAHLLAASITEIAQGLDCMKCLALSRKVAGCQPAFPRLTTDYESCLKFNVPNPSFNRRVRLLPVTVLSSVFPGPRAGTRLQVL